MSSKITIKKKRIYKEEDGGVPANHTGAAVANWNPLLGGPKVRKRHVELDGRTKQFRNVVKRIKTRNAKSQERAIKKKFAMWGVTTNPFVKENTIMDESKYLKTKTGSIEDAVITSLNTSPNENPNNTRPILHLPKKKYLESKDNSLEQMAINALVEKTDKVDPKELKGKLKDREDADIDNDGDVDQSDRFLHKRRKAINKKSKSKYVTGQGTKGDQNIRDRDDEEEATRSKKRPTAEALDKGVGSAAYTNYTKNITPGEEVDPKIVSREARIQSLAQKMTKKLQQRQKRVIDDAYRFESVEDAIDALPAEIVKEEELSTDERKALPDSAFVFPKERKYPINDIDHARAALSMGAQHATPSEYAKIKAAVKKKYPEIDVGGEKKEEVEIEAGRIDIKEYLRKRDDDEWDPKLRKGSFRRHRNIKREKHPIKTGSVEIHPEEVEEDKKWIQKAIKKPGALHRDLGVPEDDKIPVSKIKAAAKGDGKVAKRARLALTLKGMNKEEAELDELSPATKKSYTKKAASDISQRLHDPQDMGPVNRKKMDDRIKGIKRAAEEVELDELSKGTLGRYVKRASTDVAHHGVMTGTTALSGQGSDWEKHKKSQGHAKKMRKRQQGISKAVDKLSKEAIERDRPGHSRLRPKVLKPSLKGMSKKAKAILRFKDNQAKKIQNKDNRAPGEDLIK